MVRLNAMAVGLPSEVLVKLEFMNPSGSIKDRTAVAMIEEAEASGKLAKGGTIVEPTSGNTGIGIAMAAAAKGYKAVLFMPEGLSAERLTLMSAFGAETRLTPGEGGMALAVETAEAYAEEVGGVVLGQFDNPANPDVHRRTTAREILEDVPDVDYVVAGVGTGGTATGIAMGLRDLGSDAEVIGVEPAESPVISGGKPGPHGIEGIGANFVPANFDPEYVRRIVAVPTHLARETAVRLAREEGIFAGVSSGAAVAAAVRVASGERGKRIIAILPDGGGRYVSGGLYE